MQSEPTSKVCPGFCWVPRCADAGIDRPASSVQLEPRPWTRSWVFWRGVYFYLSRWRAPAWAPASSRSPSTPGTLHLWYTRGTFLLHPPSCSLGPIEGGCRTAGCSQCPNRTQTGTASLRSPQTCWGWERQSDTSPVRLSSSGKGRGDSCEKVKEQLLAVKKKKRTKSFFLNPSAVPKDCCDSLWGRTACLANLNPLKWKKKNAKTSFWRSFDFSQFYRQEDK